MNWTSLPIQHLLTKVACIAVYTADLLRMSSRSARSSLPREREENERVFLINLFQNSELSILNIIDYSGARSTDEARRHQSLILVTFGNPLSFSRLCISREQNIFSCRVQLHVSKPSVLQFLMLIAIRSNNVFSVSDHLYISCSQENEGKKGEI